jgi:hypothetical protein
MIEVKRYKVREAEGKEHLSLILLDSKLIFISSWHDGNKYKEAYNK